MYSPRLPLGQKIFLLFTFSILCLAATPAHAITTSTGETVDNGYSNIAKQLKPPQPAIHIPGLVFSDVSPTLDEDGNVSVPFLGEYIGAVYKFAMIAASVVAVIMIIVQGFQVVMSGGGEEQVAAYKNIGRIVIGLCLVWGSYFILYTVNPELVNFKTLKIKYIPPQVIKVDAADEPPTDGPATPTTGTGNVPYFAQWEGPWAKRKPGDELNPPWPLADSQAGRTDCSTIQQRGCGPTSLAMVLAYYGQSVTPLDTAKWGLGCTGAWQPSQTLGKNSANFEAKWPGLTAKTVKAEQILPLLTNGKPLVYNCAPCQGLNKDGKPAKEYSGHYVVLTKLQQRDTQGLANDQIIVEVNDPGANPTKRIMTMTMQQVLDHYRTAVYVDKK